MLLPNLPPPVEGIIHQEGNIKAFINQRCLGSGTLYIAQSRVSWAKDGATDSFSLEYPHIAVHAVSHDTATFPNPCLYLMLDVVLDVGRSAGSNGHMEEGGSRGNAANGDGDHHNEEDDDDDEDNEDEKMTQVRFVPDTPRSLEPMYKAVCDCQLLHPDQEDHPSDEEVGEFGDDEDEGEYDVIEERPNGSGGHIGYENFMENELEQQHNDGAGDEGVEDMEMGGQFDDSPEGQM